MGTRVEGDNVGIHLAFATAQGSLEAHIQLRGEGEGLFFRALTYGQRGLRHSDLCGVDFHLGLGVGGGQGDVFALGGEIIVE